MPVIDLSKYYKIVERTELVKEKTGVEIRGVRAINPVTGKEIPIFV
jgi:leucyl-tRNA synthetase